MRITPHILATCLGLLASATWLYAAEAAPSTDRLAMAARGTLRQILKSERSWVGIHAAEAMIAAGEAEPVRAHYLSDLAGFESSAFRIGVWRVLATTAATATERDSWIASIARTYLDPAAPDQNQAIETLCKLRHRVGGPTLERVRREAGETPSVRMILALWSAYLAGEPLAQERLIGILASHDPALRRIAAYALRWLHPADQSVQQALAQAATAEPGGSIALPHMLAAALTVNTDVMQAAAWEMRLRQVLAEGTTEARFEASQTLKHRFKAADLPPLATLLTDPANDTRVGAATIILTTLARERDQAVRQ